MEQQMIIRTAKQLLVKARESLAVANSPKTTVPGISIKQAEYAAYVDSAKVVCANFGLDIYELAEQVGVRVR